MTSSYAIAVATLLAGTNPSSGAGIGAEKPDFTISIDQAGWSRWGFEYPVTYVFTAASISPKTQVFRRSGDAGPWTPLAVKTAKDFFNGVECVRFDNAAKRLFVSVGFHGANTIGLRFQEAGPVRFESVSRYYDGRRSAYTLSDDNWTRRQDANPGAQWRGMIDDRSDKYQAAVNACRTYHLPVSVGIVSQLVSSPALWQRMQDELDRGDYAWEPAVHSRTHPCNAKAYAVHGYAWDITGGRDDILAHLKGIPYGQHVFEFILPCGYRDEGIERASADQFLFLRAWDGKDHPESTGFAPWDTSHQYYGIGGIQTKSYDAVMEARRPKGRYYAADATKLNSAFDAVYQAGGIFYAMWHSDRYQNSVLYDPRPGIDGQQGSTLMQHFSHVANRPDVWYVANGWLYSYRYVAERAKVE